MLDRRTTLCLACSSSLPPSVDDSELFITTCCGRPICPRCLDTNPRLARYNPCLVCLAGVGVIQASSSARNGSSGGKQIGGAGSRNQSVGVENLDGGVKDRDLFVLGDEDEDDDDDDLSMDEGRQGHRSAAPPPPDAITTVSPLLETPSPPPPVTDNREDVPVTNPTTTPPISSDGQQPYKPGVPSVYRLRRGDTLMGIALRFRLDAVELCRLNDLPTTTLSTTPHILHTRTTILLSPTSMPPTEDPTIVEARRVERAEKRLQMVTKEVDWRVAKAYVAIVQDSDPSGVPAKEKSDDYRRKVPVSGLEGSPSQRGALENGAIDRYLEDAEWEEQERKEGRGPAIQRFPWGSFGQKLGLSPGGQQGTDGFKWPWNA